MSQTNELKGEEDDPPGTDESEGTDEADDDFASSDLRKLRNAFLLADKDENGRLDFREMSDLGKLIFAKACTEESYRKMCEFVDRDPEDGLTWSNVKSIFSKNADEILTKTSKATTPE